MGCGGSKNDVATGNYAMKQKSTARNKKIEQAATNIVGSSAEAANRAEKPPVVKDIVENSDSKDGSMIDIRRPLDPAKTAKLITEEPSDRYFSSRKDESVDVVTGEGSEYFSPSPEPLQGGNRSGSEAGRKSKLGCINDSSKDNEEKPRNPDDKKHGKLAPEEGYAPISGEGEENTNEKEPVDLKETIFVEVIEVKTPAKK